MHTRLKEVRKAAGYKQQDAAEAFGVSLCTSTVRTIKLVSTNQMHS